MPATAGRARMPHNNRVDSSSALKMTGIWKNTIKYDPYAPEGDAAEGEGHPAHQQTRIALGGVFFSSATAPRIERSRGKTSERRARTGRAREGSRRAGDEKGTRAGPGANARRGEI